MRKSVLCLVMIILNLILICGCNSYAGRKEESIDNFYSSAQSVANVESKLYFWEDLFEDLDKISLMTEGELLQIEDEMLRRVGVSYSVLKEPGQTYNNIRIPMPECLNDDVMGYFPGILVAAYMKETDGMEEYTVYCICYIQGDWGVDSVVSLFKDIYLYDKETGEFQRGDTWNTQKEVVVPGSAIDCITVDENGNVIFN